MTDSPAPVCFTGDDLDDDAPGGLTRMKVARGPDDGRELFILDAARVGLVVVLDASGSGMAVASGVGHCVEIVDVCRTLRSIADGLEATDPDDVTSGTSGCGD